MATKLTLSYVCDVCEYEGTDKAEFYHYVVEVPSDKKSPKRMEIDLCGTCAGTLESDWISLARPEVKGGLTNVTVKASVPKPAFEPAPEERPTVCNKCGFEAKSWNGLLVHKKRKGHK